MSSSLSRLLSNMSRMVLRLLSCRSWVLQTAWFPRPNCCKICRGNHQLSSLAAVVAVAAILANMSRNSWSGKHSWCNGLGRMVHCKSLSMVATRYDSLCNGIEAPPQLLVQSAAGCSGSTSSVHRQVNGKIYSAQHWYLATSSKGQCAGGSNASIGPAQADGGKAVIMSGPLSHQPESLDQQTL